MSFFGSSLGWIEFLIFALVAIFMIKAIRRVFFGRMGCGANPDETPRRRTGRDRRFGALADGWQCENLDCRASNPRHARFCRICGRPEQTDEPEG